MRKFLPRPRKMFLWGVFLVALSAFLLTVFDDKRTEVPPQEWPYNQTEAEEVSLSEVWSYVDLKDLEDDSTARVGILADFVYVETDGETVKAKLPFPSSGVISDFLKFSSADLQIYETTSFEASWTDRAIQLLPIVLIALFILIILARGAGRSLGLTSAHEVVELDDLKEGFDDVAGIDDARAELQQIVELIKSPKRLTALGAKLPKGALFAGPPGTGKTLLARALAKEAGVPFVTIEASAVNQLFVGAGSMKLKAAFKAARKLGKCIVFIDEIDAVGRARGGGGPSSGASDEKETTLNALLTEMDGFEANDGIFIIAATNRPDVLDPALTRPGRFDRRVDVGLPDVQGRMEILAVHMAKIKVSEDVSEEQLSKMTYGMSGADLALLVNDASLLAADRGASATEVEDFIRARDLMIAGRTSSTRKLEGLPREITAYHEAGHAFIAHIREHADPIEKATILPTGGALGYVIQMPDTDHLLKTKGMLNASLDVAVAGRVAELLFKGPDFITTGAESDIRQATSIARSMVEKWGMSDKGFINIGDSLDPLHRGQTVTFDEVKSIIDASIARVTTDTKKRKSAVARIAMALLERETLTADEIDLLIRNKKLPPLPGSDIDDRVVAEQQ